MACDIYGKIFYGLFSGVFMDCVHAAIDGGTHTVDSVSYEGVRVHDGLGSEKY